MQMIEIRSFKKILLDTVGTETGHFKSNIFGLNSEIVNAYLTFDQNDLKFKGELY